MIKITEYIIFAMDMVHPEQLGTCSSVKDRFPSYATYTVDFMPENAIVRVKPYIMSLVYFFKVKSLRIDT